MDRHEKRQQGALRPVEIVRNFTCHAAGSVLISIGNTRVLCTASIEEKTPSFLQGKGQGWVTAEYGMLPGATHTRSAREAARGKQSGRTQEIQRLIGRSLRAITDLKALGERQITIDCDVLQADGGTRCASITGAWVALSDACDTLVSSGKLTKTPLRDSVSAISVGIYQGAPILDLDYTEDSQCDTDMNIVMTGQGGLVEIQGTAEGLAFSQDELNQMLELAKNGIDQLQAAQHASRAVKTP